MHPGTAAAIAALLVAVIVLLCWLWGSSESFCGAPGPYNLSLYDYPFRYPRYRARALMAWDKDQRCSAYCSGGDCSVVCR